MGYCKIAAAAMRDSDEELRLKRDYARYRDLLEARLRQPELARAA
jgi:hypothetical protein